MPSKPRGALARRMQGAIEFLTSYGYVFVVIAIAFIILFMYFSLPHNIIPTECAFYSGFSCKDAVLSANAAGGATLVMLVQNNQPGTMVISGFNAVIGGVSSASGSCSGASLQSGESAYCTAVFAFTPTASALYSGSANVSASYCAPQGGSSACAPSSPPVSYASSIRLQAGVPLTVTTTSPQGSTSIISQGPSTSSIPTTSIPGVTITYSTRPVISTSLNPVPYYGSSVVTATAYSVSDQVQILDNGQIVATGTGQATYTFQADEAAGSSNTITAIDTVNNQQATDVLTVTKASPVLTLTGCAGGIPSYSCTAGASITSVSNQLTGNLYLSQSGAPASLLQSTNTLMSNTAQITSTTGYLYTFNTVGNGNYLANSISVAGYDYSFGAKDQYGNPLSGVSSQIFSIQVNGGSTQTYSSGNPFPVNVIGPSGTVINSYSYSSDPSQSSGSRYDYRAISSSCGLGQSGSSISTHTSCTTMLTYYLQHYLSLSIYPSGTGSFSQGSGYYDDGSTQSVTETPVSSGYQLHDWGTSTGTGAYTGTSNPAPVVMDGPITEVATNYLKLVVTTSPGSDYYGGISTGSCYTEGTSWVPYSTSSFTYVCPSAVKSGEVFGYWTCSGGSSCNTGANAQGTGTGGPYFYMENPTTITAHYFDIKTATGSGSVCCSSSSSMSATISPSYGNYGTGFVCTADDDWGGTLSSKSWTEDAYSPITGSAGMGRMASGGFGATCSANTNDGAIGPSAGHIAGVGLAPLNSFSEIGVYRFGGSGSNSYSEATFTLSGPAAIVGVYADEYGYGEFCSPSGRYGSCSPTVPDLPSGCTVEQDNAYIGVVLCFLPAGTYSISAAVLSKVGNPYLSGAGLGVYQAA